MENKVDYSCREKLRGEMVELDLNPSHIIPARNLPNNYAALEDERSKHYGRECLDLCEGLDPKEGLEECFSNPLDFPERPR